MVKKRFGVQLSGRGILCLWGVLCCREVSVVEESLTLWLDFCIFQTIDIVSSNLSQTRCGSQNE